MRSLSWALLAIAACVPPPVAFQVAAPAPAAPCSQTHADAAAVAARFVAATEQGDFATVFELLSAEWRARYTLERLAHDFQTEPLAKERLARLKASLTREWSESAEGLTLPLAQGLAFKLHREDGALKVAALE